MFSIYLQDIEDFSLFNLDMAILVLYIFHILHGQKLFIHKQISTFEIIITVIHYYQKFHMKIAVPLPIKKPQPCPQNSTLPEISFPQLTRRENSKNISTNMIFYGPNNENLNLYNQKASNMETKFFKKHQDYASKKTELSEKQNNIYENIRAVYAESNEVLPQQNTAIEHYRTSNDSSQRHFQHNHNHPIHLHQTAKFNSFQTVSFRGSDLKGGLNPQGYLKHTKQMQDPTETKKISRQQSIGQIRSPRNQNTILQTSMQSPKSQNTTMQYVMQSPPINSPQLQFWQVQSPKTDMLMQTQTQSRVFSPRNGQMWQNNPNFYFPLQHQQQQRARNTLPVSNFYLPPMHRNYPTNQIVSTREQSQIIVSPPQILNPRFQQNMQNYVQYHQSRLKQASQQKQAHNQIQPTNQKPIVLSQEQKSKKSRPATPVRLRGRSRNKSKNSQAKKERSVTQNSRQKHSPIVSAIQSRLIMQPQLIQNQQFIREKVQLEDKYILLVQQFDQYRMEKQDEIRKLRNQLQSYLLRQRSMEEQLYYLQKQRDDKDRRLQQLTVIVRHLDQDIRMRSR